LTVVAEPLTLERQGVSRRYLARAGGWRLAAYFFWYSRRWAFAWSAPIRCRHRFTNCPRYRALNSLQL